MWFKRAWMGAFAALLAFGAWNAVVAGTPARLAAMSEEERIEALGNRVEMERQRRDGIMADVVGRVEKLEEKIRRVEEADRSLTGASSLGNVEQMKIKVERFHLERQARKEISDDFALVAAKLREWREAGRRIDEDEAALKLRKTLLEYEKALSEVTPIAAMDFTEFEYFEVKVPATLRAISSLPEIYGDAGMWKHIYEANRDKISDPSEPVKADTLLVIPSVRQGFLLEE